MNIDEFKAYLESLLELTFLIPEEDVPYNRINRLIRNSKLIAIHCSYEVGYNSGYENAIVTILFHLETQSQLARQMEICDALNTLKQAGILDIESLKSSIDKVITNE